MKKLQKLFEAGLIKIAVLPPNNPVRLKKEERKYVLPLLAHDYPAKTAVMWNKAYEKLGWLIDNVMLIADPKNLVEIFSAFKEDESYLGGGAGVGFKVEVLPFLDEIDPAAEAMGAVNFIMKTSDGKLKGYNTDGLGYAISLKDAFIANGESIKDKKVVVLGAGGAGNAIAYALAAMGAKLIILNRTVAKAKDLAEKINSSLELSSESFARFGGEDETETEVKDADAIVNVSTKGTAGEMANYSALAPAILPATEENIKINLDQAGKIFALIPKKAIISDIVLTEIPTPLLSAAIKNGYEILDGKPMVINQAIEAFFILHYEDLLNEKISKEEIKKIMTDATSM